MTATPTIPDVLPPAGATEVHDWRTEDGKTARRFWGSPIVFEIAPVVPWSSKSPVRSSPTPPRNGGSRPRGVSV